MKKILPVILCLLALNSCSKQVLHEPPLGVSMMPHYLDLDSVAPFKLDDTTRVVDSTYPDFQSIAIDSGSYITPSKKIALYPAGVLISDRKYAMYGFYKSSWERQKQQLLYTQYLMKTYYDKSKSAELLYQDEIKRLREDVKRSWLERNLPYIGFVSGALTVILVDVAVAQTFR